MNRAINRKVTMVNPTGSVLFVLVVSVSGWVIPFSQPRTDSTASEYQTSFLFISLPFLVFIDEVCYE